MKEKASLKRGFPWALWLLAIVTVAAAYVFFFLPRQLGKREMKIEFQSSEPSR